MATLLVRPNGNVVVTVRLTFRPGRDDAQIALVQAAPHGALANIIREAMREGIKIPDQTYESDAEEQPLDWSGLGMDV